MNQTQQCILERYFKEKCKGFLKVVHIVKNVCVYRYRSSWEDTELEGRLYLYRCTDSPNYKILILHKKELANFELEITDKICIELHQQFIILSMEDKSLHLGLWFENARDAMGLHEYIIGK